MAGLPACLPRLASPKAPEAKAPEATAGKDEAPELVLAAAAEAVLKTPIQTDRYAEHFRWRFENRKTIRARYLEVLQLLSDEAQRQHGCGFLAATAAQRHEVLAALRKSGRPRVAEFERDVFSYYFNMDSWQACGLGPWPGVPRGLVNYQQPGS